MPLVQAGLAFAFLQTGGVFGRILWGAVAGRFVSSRKLLALLGITTAVLVAGTAALTSDWSFSVISILGFILGASSFGWNGVFLAEIATRAPEGKISEATGGVQFVMFGGVVVMPPMFGALVSATQSYTAAFFIVAAAALLAGVYLATGFTHALQAARKDRS